MNRVIAMDGMGECLQGGGTGRGQGVVVSKGHGNKI